MIGELEARRLLLAGETLVDIGQFDGAAKRMLSRNVRAGRVSQTRELWSGVAVKTHYRIAEAGA